MHLAKRPRKTNAKPQPDLVFISSASRGIIQQRSVFGIPDLLVELVSPSSVRRDRYDKEELYAPFGVKEYWIGDPANKILESPHAQKRQLRIALLRRSKRQTHFARRRAELEFDLSEIQ